MANANTNLMSINSTRPTSSVNSTSSRSETKYKSASSTVSKKENFSTALDKAKQDSKTFSDVDKAVEQNKVEAEATDAAIKASSQGQNEKTQDAPPKENVTENTEKITQNDSAEITSDGEEILPADSKTSEVVEVVQPENFSANLVYFFATDPMALLTPTNVNSAVNVEVETNLMTIMPQTENNQATSMLDLLSGKTWKSADVDASISQQNQPQTQPTNLNQSQVQIQPTNLNQSQVQIQPTNLNQAQVQIQPTNLNQAQVEIQPTNLNQAQVQVQPTNLNQAQVETQQPINLNQAQVQTQPTNLNQAQVEIQPTNLNQAQVEIQPTNLNQSQVEIQPTNLNQYQVEIQPTNLNQAQVQQPTNLNQAQVEVQPTNLNQAQVQQPTNLNQAQVEVQPTNLNQVQVQQPTNLNQSQVEIQPTNLNQAQQVEIQPTNLNQAQVQIQPTNLNQTQVQIQQPANLNQPQAQQQQFGQEISPIVNAEQPQPEIKPLRQNQFQPITASENLLVEEEQPTLQTVPIHQSAKNFEQNQPQSNNFAQNNFQQSAENEIQPQNFSNGGETFSSHLTANNNSSPVQQTAQTQNPEAAQQAPRENFDIPSQIVEHARLIRRAENTEMVINLKPEHLGAMTLKITVSHTGALNASFYSDNAQVRAIIENSLVQLKNELNEQGLKVEHVEVYAGLSDGGSLMNGRGQQAWQQNQQQRNSGRRINLNAVEESADATAPVNNSESTDGVDYKV